jgi:hypothetical protein
MRGDRILREQFFYDTTNPVSDLICRRGRRVTRSLSALKIHEVKFDGYSVLGLYDWRASVACRVTLEQSIKSGPGLDRRHHDDTTMRDKN